MTLLNRRYIVVVIKDIAIGAGGLGLITELVQLDKASPTALAVPALFLRSCVAQALGRVDRPRHSLHVTS